MLTNSIAHVGRSLVFLEIERPGGIQVLGTGYVVSGAGLLATACHLVEGAAAIHARVVGAGGGRRRGALGCEAVELDPRADVALLRVRASDAEDRPSFEPVTLHAGPPVAVGQEVAFLGFPYADVFDPPLVMAARGIVGNRYSVGGAEYLVLDAACAEGMSGGPVFLPQSGEVVGTLGSRFDPARARAKRAGVGEGSLSNVPRERTNITFASSVAVVAGMLGRVAGR